MARRVEHHAPERRATGQRLADADVVLDPLEPPDEDQDVDRDRRDHVRRRLSAAPRDERNRRRNPIGRQQPADLDDGSRSPGRSRRSPSRREGTRGTSRPPSPVPGRRTGTGRRPAVSARPRRSRTPRSRAGPRAARRGRPARIPSGRPSRRPTLPRGPGGCLSSDVRVASPTLRRTSSSSVAVAGSAAR